MPDLSIGGFNKAPTVINPQDWLEVIKRKVEHDALLESGAFKDWKQKRMHETDAWLAPQEHVWLDIKPSHSDYYRKEALKQFGSTASRHRVDPLLFTALGISESGLGNQHPGNPTRVDVGVHGRRMEELGYDPHEREDLIDYSARYLGEQLDKHGDLLDAVQAYSGKGKTIYKGQVKDKKFFGKKVKDINFWKDKPQGKRVLAIAEQLRNIPEVQSLLTEE